MMTETLFEKYASLSDDFLKLSLKQRVIYLNKVEMDFDDDGWSEDIRDFLDEYFITILNKQYDNTLIQDIQHLLDACDECEVNMDVLDCVYTSLKSIMEIKDSFYFASDVDMYDYTYS